ncbi:MULTISPECIES: type IV conjugative transfer system protein TraL [Pseudomonas]|uniref:Sex pilus assembly protein TrhL n=1 Tax=Pseudomonas luteola TaxID=47886 RepID=A0A2X2DWJ4_PSELU|nr:MULTISPECIES: type IV conjugative transfer system protein TraL [Pseudomonas]RRW40244.1 type IV conjugative transfer system protein TraL [Pseudomonas luteola]SHJ41496.1 conjugal transfer pilus assembly protein TraL [Pseudomonas zeshuii]SPZ00099.1 sex pilus assembly protein TrhL [Pseudomonas luteola]SPZ00307.1 sex pilus assembly protein TrhL [Pseudomonas luteola]
MKAINIPTRCDDPLHVLIWSLDELVPIGVGLLFGMAIGKALLCGAIGYAVTFLYQKYKDGHADGYLIHVGYWLGILPSRSTTLPNPYARRWLP